MKKAKFAMAFHCHQPVDNFGWEFERAYANAYLPLLDRLEEFPLVRASLHYSGNMLEWLEQEHPDYVDRVAALVRSGQIEIIGGGCFEPVLAMIPERDREGQIRLNHEIISRLFGARPRGLWIAEKVWEPQIGDTLVRSGARYTIVDDYHMFRAGLSEDDMYGPCVTRVNEGAVTLFPSLTRLRYYMPFKLPEVTLGYMKRITEKRKGETTCFFFADDAEKFGAWPYTYWWVHKRGWLKNFFALLSENSDWLETLTYSGVSEEVPPKEVGPVPSSSYAEMMEWSGGDFRNFLSKYPEADRMHKRMLSVSDKLGSLGEEEGISGSRMDEARKELFKAQTSCAYWHGTFGGLYLPHLRSGVYSHLICAENMVEDMAGRGKKGAVIALERQIGKGKSETLLRNDIIDIFADTEKGGALTELDYKPLCVNLMNTMSRVREGYHDKLEKKNAARIKRARKAIIRGDFADVHDVLGVRHRGLEKMLIYDNYRKASFLTHIFRGDGAWDDMRKASSGHNRFLKDAYAHSVSESSGSIELALTRRDKVFTAGAGAFDLEVVKKVRLGKEAGLKLSHRIIRHSGEGALPGYAVEFNFSLWDDTVKMKPGSRRTDHFSLRDRHSGLALYFLLNRDFTVFMYPVYTVNETEAGLSKTFQGISVVIGDDDDHRSGLDAPEMDIELKIGKT